MSTLPYGTNQLIDPTMARALHTDACRDPALVGRLGVAVGSAGVSRAVRGAAGGKDQMVEPEPSCDL